MPPTPPSRSPAPSRRRLLATLALLVAGLLGLAALAERAWLGTALTLVSDAPPQAAAPEQGRRLPSPFLLVIVDGLREAATADMPRWKALADEFVPASGAGGASGVALCGEPTMSAPCVRAIVAGRAPDLYTSFRDFTPLPVRGTVLDLVAATGARVAHAGDSLLPRLVPTAYAPADVLALPRGGFSSPAALDDFAMPDALEKAADEAVDSLTVHLVTVDLVGHASGADGPAYAEAVRTADARLGDLVLAFRTAHTGAHVLVAADHGLSPRGTHGAGEPDARRAPFVLVGPRVRHRRGVVIPQTSLATTLAAILHLPTPPLAETPPALALTRLSPTERVASLDQFVASRAAALDRAGDSLGARGLREARRAAMGATSADKSVTESRLLAVVSGLLAPHEGPLPALAAAAAVLLVAALAGTAAGRSGVAAAAAAVLAAAAAGGAGLAVQRMLLTEPSPAGPQQRTLVVAGGLLAAAGLTLATRVRRGRRAPVAGSESPATGAGGDERPAGLSSDAVPLGALAAVGVLLAGLRSFRLAVDRAIHLPLLVGGMVVVAAVVAAWREPDAGRSRARRARSTFAAAVALLVAVTRALDLGAAPGSTAAALAPWIAWLLVLAAAFAGSRVPIDLRRTDGRGVCGLVALLALARVAAFHALGGSEGIASIDPDRLLVPGAAGAAASGTLPEGLLALVLHEGPALAIVLAAAAAACARGGSLVAFPRVLAGLAVATGAGAAALVAGAWSWSSWSWWMVVALPVYLLAVADAVVLALAGVSLAAGAALVGARRRAPASPRTPSAAPSGADPRVRSAASDGARGRVP